jgi:cell division protein FtsQ
MRIRARVLLWPLLAGGVLAAVPNMLDEVLDQPVGRIVIESTFQRVTPIQIEATVAPSLDEGFWSLDLDALRARLDALAWVDAAELRRRWPDTLVVRITEQHAAARWRDEGLLNARGELFAERPEHGFPELPRLSGPDGSEREVARRYLELRERLIDAHLTIDTLYLDERGSWRLVLASGQEVRFGRHDVEERVDRFFDVAAPALAAELHRVRYVDLRYTNGFAVGWSDETDVDQAAGSAAGGELAVRETAAAEENGRRG